MARPRKFDEATVMEAVREQFRNNGYAATSLDDLMQVTGLGKGSLYGAFGDKRQLFLRVFNEYCADSVESVRTFLKGDDAGALDRLRAYFQKNVAAIGRDTTNRGCLLGKATAELSSVEPEVAERSLQTYRAFESLFVSSLRQAQRHGDIRADADIEKLAAMLLSVFRGIEALGKAGMDEATLTDIVETTFALL
jgi:TetR/AcrR family transcriptional regulator, transcriptional repressor for nem operon